MSDDDDDNSSSNSSRDSDIVNKGKKISNNLKGGDIIPVQAQYLEVPVLHNNFDRAAKIFRSLVQKERILSSYKEHQAYEKPSDKKRRKRAEMKRKRSEIENKPIKDLKKKKNKSYQLRSENVDENKNS